MMGFAKNNNMVTKEPISGRISHFGSERGDFMVIFF